MVTSLQTLVHRQTYLGVWGEVFCLIYQNAITLEQMVFQPKLCDTITIPCIWFITSFNLCRGFYQNKFLLLHILYLYHQFNFCVSLNHEFPYFLSFHYSTAFSILFIIDNPSANGFSTSLRYFLVLLFGSLRGLHCRLV